MPKQSEQTTCYVKAFRQERGWSQDQLAEMIGVRRQAIYDIESGRYLPNTGVALRLARQFGCRVEDLFVADQGVADQSITMVHDHWTAPSRVCVASIRGRLMGFSLDGRRSLSDSLRPADGVLSPDGKHVQLFSAAHSIDKTTAATNEPATDKEKTPSANKPRSNSRSRNRNRRNSNRDKTTNPERKKRPNNRTSGEGSKNKGPTPKKSES